MIKALAFYLPQYHPIPENDQWWGEGFTEWRNVSAAKPRFRTHYQPHIPSDLGFYDLRVSETREKQANLAREYGIHGFCYYHYWFNGKQLLERPIQEVLKERTPDFPFCMCWANENWTRAWDGLEREVLISQKYTLDDSIAHIESLLPYFLDDRYIKVNGKPLFLIYRPDHISDSTEYFSAWTRKAKEAGLPGLYLCAVKNGFVKIPDQDIISRGYDAIIDFQPNRQDFPPATTSSQFLVDLARKLLPDASFQWLKINLSAENRIDYNRLIDALKSRPWPKEYRKFPAVFPSWDNTARRKTPTIIQNTSPTAYKEWVRHAAGSVFAYPLEERFIFINAWNEWAEGCHLEPDLKLARGFLEATREALLDCSSFGTN